MKLFMDNVPTLAIQAPIVRKLDEIMCPTSVFRMDAEIITSIAGESEEKVHEREEVISKLAVLEAGARICKQYALRHSGEPPTEPIHRQFANWLRSCLEG